MTQYAVPNADTYTGGWTKVPVGEALLYVKIDETPVASADDTDYIQVVEGEVSEEDYVDGTATFTLSAITDPENSVNHFVRYRAEDNSGAYAATPSFDVKLYQSSTLIASKRHTGGTVITSNDPPFANYSIELSSSEANSITDYSALKLTIIMDNDGDENSSIQVSQLFFETDDVGGGGGGGGPLATTGGAPDSFSIGVNGFGSNFSLE